MSVALSTRRTAYGDAGLLVLRIVTGTTLLLKHGLEKAFHFSAMAARSPDPVHIGVVPSLIFSLISDFVCSILIIVGLGVRWAALIVIVNISIAWALVEHFQFFGRNGTGDHGELIVLYLGGLAALLLTGAGRYSIDYLISKRQR